MIRSKFNLSVLALSLCILASAQSAVASSKMSSLKSLQAMDVNDDFTAAGKAHDAQLKFTAETCPFADKSGRNDVAVAAADSALGGSSVSGKIRR